MNKIVLKAKSIQSDKIKDDKMIRFFDIKIIVIIFHLKTITREDFEMFI